MLKVAECGSIALLALTALSLLLGSLLAFAHPELGRKWQTLLTCVMHGSAAGGVILITHVIRQRFHNILCLTEAWFASLPK